MICPNELRTLFLFNGNKIISYVRKAVFYLKELNEIKDDVVDNMYIQAMIEYFKTILDLINGNGKRILF